MEALGADELKEARILEGNDCDRGGRIDRPAFGVFAIG